MTARPSDDTREKSARTEGLVLSREISSGTKNIPTITTQSVVATVELTSALIQRQSRIADSLPTKRILPPILVVNFEKKMNTSVK
jgi:hypothetical protein